MSASMSMTQARDHVVQHLWRAETMARARDVSGLDPVRSLLRALLLYELGRYRMRGDFPQNPDFAEPTPYFVDAAGTRCAVSHLLDLTGETELVQRIARERNHARVRELANEPRLVAWLAAAGLTLEEAAAIQPSYLSSRADCVCGNNFGPGVLGNLPAAGVIVGSVTEVNGNELRIRVDSAEGNIEPYQIEQEIDAWAVSGKTAQVGDTVVVPIATASDAPRSLRAAVLTDDDGYTCVSEGVSLGPLDTDQLTGALLADSTSSCKDMLASINPKWGERIEFVPEGGTKGSYATSGEHDGAKDGVEEGSQGGCSTRGSMAGANDPTPLGLLLALGTLIVARTRSRRPR